MNRCTATGSKPAKIPSLALDSPRVWDSTSALDLPSIPKSLLVIGGGYIGLELGTVYNAIGSKVTVVEMMPGLLPGADRLRLIESPYGHDGFLIETDQVGALVRELLPPAAEPARS